MDMRTTQMTKRMAVMSKTHTGDDDGALRGHEISSSPSPLQFFCICPSSSAYDVDAAEQQQQQQQEEEEDYDIDAVVPSSDVEEENESQVMMMMSTAMVVPEISEHDIDIHAGAEDDHEDNNALAVPLQPLQHHEAKSIHEIRKRQRRDSGDIDTTMSCSMPPPSKLTWEALKARAREGDITQGGLFLLRNAFDGDFSRPIVHADDDMISASRFDRSASWEAEHTQQFISAYHR